MNTRRTRPRLEALESRALFSATLVKDITTLGSGHVQKIDEMTDVSGTLFFRSEGSGGYELWKSDGTTAGTVRVKDIAPGSSASFPRELTNVNGTLYFGADDGTNGIELWKSDGTEAGTVMVKDINPGGITFPHNMANVNGTLYFNADDGTNGPELWKSDGTAAGTVMVKDISPGYSYGPQELANLNGLLIFSVNNELWKSDGTADGTLPLPGGVDPGSFTNVNGTLFFTANTSAYGTELWKTDGTAVGTVMVKDIFPGFGTIQGFSSTPGALTNVNGTLFFSATDRFSTIGTNGRELWKSDGSTDGTVLVKDILAGQGDSSPRHLINVGGTLFFQADDGNGSALWKSDGSTTGTVLVKQLGIPTGTQYPYNFANLNGVLYFSGDDGSTGSELWRSDGTTAGTVLATDVNPGATGSNPNSFTNVGDALFFVANDGVHGPELWMVGPPPPDTTGASIASTAFKGATSGTFDKITLTFSEAVQASTVNATNITLTGPSGSISITNITAVAGSNNTQFDVAFASQNTLGDYTLNAAVGILDLAGNPLPQAFSVTRTLGASTGPRIVAIGQSDGSVKMLDGATNEVLVANFRPLDANGQQYKSGVAVALGDLDGDGIDELFIGAQKRAGVAGLDASKAGKVFVYNTATVIDTGSTTPFDTITPFAKNFDGTQTYETGFELATGDVNGDGVLDLIASSRGDVGQISVMSGVGTGTGHTRLGSVVTPFGTSYRGKVSVAAGNFIAETGTQNDEVAAARGNTDSTNSSRIGTSTRVAMFDLVGSSLNAVTFSGAISSQGIPSQIAGSAGQVIDRNAFVSSINLGGTGADLLLFAARDFVSNLANPQIRVAVYGVNASGFANLQSSNADGDGGSYTVGNQVGSYAIARSDIDDNGADSLAMVIDGPSAGVLYLAPLTGADLGGLTTPVLTGGVRITSN